MALSTPLAISDILEANFQSYAEGQLGENVIHYEVTALSGTGCHLEAAALGLGDDGGPLYAAIMSTLATFRGVRLRRVWPLPKTYTVPLSGTSLSGSQTGKLLPTQCRGLLTRFNTLGGPKNRARAFLPFPTIDFLSAAGGTTAAYVTAADFLGSFLSVPYTAVDGAGTATLVPRILTRSAVPLSAGLHRIDSWIVGVDFATQKSSGQLGRPNP
jgi:hypothetical protein